MIFRANDADDENEASLAGVLKIMSDLWNEKRFKATELADAINDKKATTADGYVSIYPLEDEDRATLRGYFCPKLPDDKLAMAKSVGWALREHV